MIEFENILLHGKVMSYLFLYCDVSHLIHTIEIIQIPFPRTPTLVDPLLLPAPAYLAANYLIYSIMPTLSINKDPAAIHLIATHTIT